MGIRRQFNLPIAAFVAVLGIALLGTPAVAQRRGGSSGFRGGAGFRSGARVGASHARPRRFFPGTGLLGYPDYYLGDYDDDYAPEAAEGPGVRVIVLRPDRAAAAPESTVEPLLMEYHDGKWVRIATAGQLPTNPAPTQQDSSATNSPLGSQARPQPGSQSGTADGQAATTPPAPTPAAVLVFRDGHREEVKKYTIKGNVIYASADYWSTGSWTKEIPVAQLDVPATLAVNAERGGKFALPGGPDEVVIRF